MKDCVKVYETRIDAQNFAHRVNYESGGVLELWPYRCPYCLKFHTSADFLESVRLDGKARRPEVLRPLVHTGCVDMGRK